MLSRDQIRQLRSEPLKGANKLTRAKELAGVTQVQIQEATGLRQSYISRIEAGKYSRLPTETSRSLANYFGCHIEDLFPSREAVAS